MTESYEKHKIGELTADMSATKLDIIDIKSGHKNYDDEKNH